MKLTVKAKNDFLKWAKKRCNIKLHELIKMEMWFSIQDNAFKNALIIEWFDSVGIWSNIVNDMLIIDKDYFKKFNWQTNVELLIITANEIYNEKQE
ncbi:hypothetical protein [Myroides odoratus]|uniref:Uncharacterized protein n=1 Tax=Myroides odoratus TaxID=256 RepID=A0A9Q6Z2P4_MYROD|nr:hypothetical protein [Myroides odoratus]EHQ41520.1 hypothetical protein Myrod_0684 [Myroides odoratus DSM 2801]EKB02687.1 hypothetical protein HMPREF9716_03716 [Myroides odoratus CIP 103059]QQT98942.1 hypothetical protein I6I88_12040 [Myroides odoratus]WQD58871.1 hypothetical protein U0010_06935 [Myroides odoratus]STZ28783.1 Uncharacterised protein [Myroides odoratus]